MLFYIWWLDDIKEPHYDNIVYVEKICNKLVFFLNTEQIM